MCTRPVFGSMAHSVMLGARVRGSIRVRVQLRDMLSRSRVRVRVRVRDRLSIPGFLGIVLVTSSAITLASSTCIATMPLVRVRRIKVRSFG